MTFDSVHEILNPLTDIRKMKFWDFLSGDALDNWWAISESTGSGGMDNVIDGGYQQTTGAVLFNAQSKDFGNLGDHYSATASQILAVAKCFETTLMEHWFACLAGDGAAYTHKAYMGADTGPSANFLLKTTNAGGTTNTASSIAIDTNFHVFEAKFKSSSVTGHIANILEGTSTTDLPSDVLQVVIRAATLTGATRKSAWRYLEVYNT